jgi:hypothetical protein
MTKASDFLAVDPRLGGVIIDDVDDVVLVVD